MRGEADKIVLTNQTQKMVIKQSGIPTSNPNSWRNWFKSLRDGEGGRFVNQLLSGQTTMRPSYPNRIQILFLSNSQAAIWIGQRQQNILR